jgi:DNA-binding XRE family transcriptional regulator
MRSTITDVLPSGIIRSLKKFGADIGLARRKRRLTEAMLAERVGVARATYQRVEKGDPSVALGVYAMTLFVLGLGDPFSDLVDSRNDDQGLILDAERLPKRVRAKKEPTSQ